MINILYILYIHAQTRHAFQLKIFHTNKSQKLKFHKKFHSIRITNVIIINYYLQHQNYLFFIFHQVYFIFLSPPKIEDKIQRKKVWFPRLPVNHCSLAPRQRIKDVTSFSCLLQPPRKGTKFRFVPRQERGRVKKGKKEKKMRDGEGLVNNTKRQLARKRRYFSGGARERHRVIRTKGVEEG